MPRSTLPGPPPARLPKTALMRRVEAAHGGRDVREVLIELYNQRGNQAGVAAALGLPQATVQRWFRRCGIHTVTWAEAFLPPGRGDKKTPTEGGQLG
ncbi:MAG: hypothetical protein IT317_17095 [Anaerolineales bacterium]|nr:hypothetical protein [Anaerolineales bacterium]